MMENIGNMALLAILFSVELVGLFALFIPGLPGLTVIWVSVLIFGIIQGFEWPGLLIFIVITVLMLIGNLADNFLMSAGARKTGASWLSIGVALAAGILGSILAPPLGGLFLAVAGIFLVEFIRHKNWRMAFASTRSLAAGCGWAVAARFVIGLIMIILWVVWVLVRDGGVAFN